MNLLLLVGEIGSGKSTLANILTKYGYYEETFASPIKQFAINIGFDIDDIYGNQVQKNKVNDFWQISGRQFMQLFGTDLCRELLPSKIPMQLNGRNLWVRIMEKKISSYKEKNKLLVISDGRFKDEIKLVKEYNGKIIRIIRPDNPYRLNEFNNKHLSEIDIIEEPADYSIINNGIESMEEQILKIISSRC